MKRAGNIANNTRASPALRAFIFGAALLHLVHTILWVSRWSQKFGAQSGDFYPDVFLVVPSLLVLASALLLPGRRWGYLPALAISGWLLYSLGYGGLLSVSAAHDKPFFSFYVPRVWFMQTYAAQPQELLELSLALVIICYVAFALAHRRRKYV
jgi:hypothetical protein